MYRQFCKNLKNYLDINESGSYRYKIGKELEPLSNPGLYKNLKESNHVEYMRISNLIYEIANYEGNTPSIEKFIWELWAYGFDVKKIDEVTNNFIDKDDDIKEKIKLIDLLLGTHYWN